ncbi:MAG: PmoA family protein, partial [Candidatus Hydrogenedentes bacterium]|nr:PmoA family protein [Candidatus Hydrogenedentota bacterium]
QPGQAPVLRDARRISISAPSTLLRLIDFDITLEALTPVRIEKTNHSLFSARVVPELSVQAGGTLVNAEGKRGEPETFGVPSPWCDYSGTRDGKVEGLAIFQHPANRWYPAPWFTRDYGFFSPTPMYWLEGDHLDLEQGERLRLRYRVVVHGGALEHEEIATLFREYAAMP